MRADSWPALILHSWDSSLFGWWTIFFKFFRRLHHCFLHCRLESRRTDEPSMLPCVSLLVGNMSFVVIFGYHKFLLILLKLQRTPLVTGVNGYPDKETETHLRHLVSQVDDDGAYVELSVSICASTQQISKEAVPYCCIHLCVLYSHIRLWWRHYGRISYIKNGQFTKTTKAVGKDPYWLFRDLYGELRRSESTPLKRPCDALHPPFFLAFFKIFQKVISYCIVDIRHHVCRTDMMTERGGRSYGKKLIIIIAWYGLYWNSLYLFPSFLGGFYTTS